jgi:uncharacterized protein YdeI (YjbR/CyaY-like superfamily)
MSAAPKFFKNAAAWRRWLEKNHGTAAEVIVGFHKVFTGKPSITYQEALDEALCFGWIDGVRRGGDATWQIRFTPRRAKSIWSAVNIKRIEELKAEGRMQPSGLAAFDARDPERQKRYSSENRSAALSPADEKTFRANKKAWANFTAMPPSYRRPAIWWVASARKEETRQRRLATLIEDSEAGRRVPPLTPPAKRK